MGISSLSQNTRLEVLLLYSVGILIFSAKNMKKKNLAMKVDLFLFTYEREEKK